MQNYDAYVEILGKQYDINIEKGKENKSIDDAIQKRKDEIKQLEDKIQKEGDSNGKTQEKIDKLKTENSQLEDAKTKLSGINSTLDTQTSKYDTANNKLAKVNGKFQEAGGLTDDNIKKTDIWNGKLDKNHTKDVNVKTNKDPDEENVKWSTPIKKVVSIVTDGLSKLKFWAKGTNYHPGGDAVLGEEGPELVEHGGKLSLASFGMYDLPVGAKVFTHGDTVNMLRNGLVSGISRGISLNEPMTSTQIDATGGATDVTPVLIEQNRILTQLLISSQNLERKPVLSEGDIKRSYDRLDFIESTKNNIFKGRPGGGY